jgi:hypothetical protein
MTMPFWGDGMVVLVDMPELRLEMAQYPDVLPVPPHTTQCTRSPGFTEKFENPTSYAGYHSNHGAADWLVI